MINEAMAEADFLRQVEEKLATVLRPNSSQLPSSDAILKEAGRYLCLTNSAKRARPLLVLYFGEALQVSMCQLVDVAVVAELIHAASLMHDDVIDEATLRRGNPSVNCRYGNNIAVLGGNYLLSLAFELISSYPASLIKDAVEVIAQMTRAAVAEIEVRGKWDLSFEAWEEIAAGKTGALFGWCLRAVVQLSAESEMAERMGKVGRLLGIVFQMADDVRDLCETNSLKNRFADIKNQEPSSVLIEAVRCSEHFKFRLQNAWQKSNLSYEEAMKLGEEVLKTSAVDNICIEMKKYISVARDNMGYLDDTPGGQKIALWSSQLLDCLR